MRARLWPEGRCRGAKLCGRRRARRGFSGVRSEERAAGSDAWISGALLVAKLSSPSPTCTALLARACREFSTLRLSTKRIGTAKLGARWYSMPRLRGGAGADAERDAEDGATQTGKRFSMPTMSAKRFSSAGLSAKRTGVMRLSTKRMVLKKLGAKRFSMPMISTRRVGTAGISTSWFRCRG